MTFEDLPSDIRTTPLTDPQLRADLIDLIVGEEDREFGSIAIWLCDEDLIGDKDQEPNLRYVAMGPLFVAVGRPGSPLFTRDDLAFANEVVELCESRGVLCLGVFVATPASVREVPEALRRVA